MKKERKVGIEILRILSIYIAQGIDATRPGDLAISRTWSNAKIVLHNRDAALLPPRRIYALTHLAFIVALLRRLCGFAKGRRKD